MSKKKRVYELAKEYGLTGQKLAAKLKELGVSEIKGHMTAMDDFLLLKVQGTLEANGIVPESKPEETTLEAGGLTIRKKKKKKKTLAEAIESQEARAGAKTEPAPEPPAPEPAAAAEEAPEVAPAAEQPATAPAPKKAAPKKTAAPSRKAAAKAGEPSAPVEPVEPVEPVAPVEAKGEPVVETPETATVAEAPAAEAVASGGEVTTAAGEAGAEAPAEGLEAADEPKKIVSPSAKRRQGKVVGFVDLSKVQSPPTTRRPDSRRLRSKDDVAPDVKPTLGHDRKRALMRGDHASRGQLTAAQLRERESGRFLRRRGPGGPGGYRGGPGGGRGGRHESVGSPYAGSEVKIEAPITIKKLADALSVKVNQVIGRAFTSLGMPVTINSTLDDVAATMLAEEFDVTVVVTYEVAAEEALLGELVKKRTSVEEDDLVTRPPTLAFLGHVDHGKTTLLDQVRRSRVTQGESGGITQHLGAYQVETKSGHTLTIIDTPGHEAFTAMRARGASAVDLVVLVVAADDGVMPSTIEAIQHARAAKTPIVVAINKCDKPEANPSRVKQQLTAHELLSEDFGGDTAMLEVSALKGTGVEELLERVFLESEVLELKAHAKGPATGVVLEAEINEGHGRVAYLLVKDGTLSRGDVILAGEGFGKVKTLIDDRGKVIQNAGPSRPVMVSGLNELPGVGDEFHVVDRLEQASEVAEERRRKIKAMSLSERRAVTTETLMQAVAERDKTVINVVLKCDVQGSLQALQQQIDALTHEEVDVRVLGSGLGPVNESDVNLAITSGALVFAFRVGVHDKGRVAAERNQIEIRHFEVIYELLDELRDRMEGKLAPEMTEQITGHIEVRALFKSSKVGLIAGCHVLDGAVHRDNKLRVKRGNDVIHSGAFESLRREKDDVREVREGFDCGVVLKGFEAWELGDVIEAYKMVAVKRLLKI